MDQVDDEQTVHWSIRSVTAGREVVRADRLYLPLNPQALGKSPCCGPVKVPVVGAAVRGPEARNAERARSTPPAARPAPTRCHSGEALRARADVAPHACRAAGRRASASRLDRDQAVEQRAPASFRSRHLDVEWGSRRRTDGTNVRLATLALRCLRYRHDEVFTGHTAMPATSPAPVGRSRPRPAPPGCRDPTTRLPAPS